MAGSGGERGKSLEFHVKRSIYNIYIHFYFTFYYVS